MSRTIIGAALGCLVLTLGLSPTPTTPAAQADDTAEPVSVALVGSLQSELGCGTDWDPACPATELELTDGTWQQTYDVPAGEHEWKVALNDGWDESYGVGTGNLPLPLERATRLTFRYDPSTHRVSVTPTDPPAPVGRADRGLAGDSLRESLTRERLYFVMADRFENGDPANDRAGLGDDRLVSGYDPTATGFFHGGDLQGVIDRLDYIEGLGTTAIWLTPSFKNKPVQGAPGSESAGYHGYWITDFTRIDPHLGTNRDMKRLVRLAHRRDIKVFFDIITNHTADVIGYDEATYDAHGTLPYVSTEDEPYRDATGTEFDDREYADGDPTFPPVNAQSFPYEPVVPEAERDVKVPGWLNDPTLYHNRGTSTFSGESSTYGDFPSGPYSALDDLWTEHPQVVEGMSEIYQNWVTEVGIDGFRIDTVKHVNTEFWQQFSPALVEHAAAAGQDDFFMFGEIYDQSSRFVSQYTTEGRVQAAVDFGFQGRASAFANGGATEQLSAFYAEDDWYTDADSNAYQLPTFLGNHDMGRIGSFVRQEGGSEADVLRRDRLAHTLMYLTRGQPVVYYGDEQGFSAPSDVPGGIGDQRAREDMFPSEVDLYNDFDLIGTDATTARSNFDRRHPLYRHIQALARLRERHPALADGAQVPRWSADEAGVFAVSRIDADRQREYVVALNNSTTNQTVGFDTDTPSTRFERIWSTRPGQSGEGRRTSDDGRIQIAVPAQGAVVYRAHRQLPGDGRRAPAVDLVEPGAGGDVSGRSEVAADVRSGTFTQATFAWRRVGAVRWTVLGTDDQAPFRVFHDVRELPLGTAVEYRAIVEDADGDLGVDQTSAMVAAPAAATGPDWGGPVTQPQSVTVPGSLNTEMGCAADWSPKCLQAQLTLDEEDAVWSATFSLPQGQYAHKVAVDPLQDEADGWTENYGAGAIRNGENIGLETTGDPVTFYFSRATNWITSSVETPHLYTATGDFQSELGCGVDDDPACLRSWLQDPDGDGTWVLRNHTLPPGSYAFRIAQDQTATGGTWGEGGAPGGVEVTFTLEEGQGVQIEFRPGEAADPSTPAESLTVSTYAAPPPQ